MTALRTSLAVAAVLAGVVAGTVACGADEANVGGATMGQTVYRQQCATCHGPDRKGVGSVPPLDPAKLAALGPGGIKAVVVNGKNAMTGFGDRLTPAQLDAVATYLLAG